MAETLRGANGRDVAGATEQWTELPGQCFAPECGVGMSLCSGPHWRPVSVGTSVAHSSALPRTDVGLCSSFPIINFADNEMQLVG